MKNKIFCSVVKNKNNGQIHLSLPKKKISKDLLKDLDVIKKLKIKIEGWK